MGTLNLNLRVLPTCSLAPSWPHLAYIPLLREAVALADIQFTLESFAGIGNGCGKDDGHVQAMSSQM